MATQDKSGGQFLTAAGLAVFFCTLALVGTYLVVTKEMVVSRGHLVHRSASSIRSSRLPCGSRVLSSSWRRWLSAS